MHGPAACWSQLMQSGILAVRFKTPHPLTIAICIHTHSIVKALLFQHSMKKKSSFQLTAPYQHHADMHAYMYSSVALNAYLFFFVRLNQTVMNKTGQFHANVHIYELNPTIWCGHSTFTANKWSTLFKWIGMQTHSELDMDIGHTGTVHGVVSGS